MNGKSKAGKEAFLHIYREIFININTYLLLKLGLLNVRIYMCSPSDDYIKIAIFEEYLGGSVG